MSVKFMLSVMFQLTGFHAVTILNYGLTKSNRYISPR